MSEKPESPQESQKGQQKITIDIPQDVKVIYSNIALISHTPAEMVFDFAQMLPRSNRGSILARVIMSPMHAKMLQLALAQNLANYERQFGEIHLPQQKSPLADNFFRFRSDDEDKGDDE